MFGLFGVEIFARRENEATNDITGEHVTESKNNVRKNDKFKSATPFLNHALGIVTTRF